jgi:hypothetical protein
MDTAFDADFSREQVEYEAYDRPNDYADTETSRQFYYSLHV